MLFSNDKDIQIIYNTDIFNESRLFYQLAYMWKSIDKLSL